MLEKQIILSFIKIMKFLTMILENNPGRRQLRWEVKGTQYHFKTKIQ